jgi:hypothetical protein
VISESWWKGFYKRHPNISLRTPEALNRLRARTSNREVVESVFTLFSTLIEKYGINARDVWNCDEIGFSLGDNGKQIKVLARRGSRNVISKLLKMEVMLQYWLLPMQREVSCHRFLSSNLYISLMIFFLRPLLIHL